MHEYSNLGKLLSRSVRWRVKGNSRTNLSLKDQYSGVSDRRVCSLYRLKKNSTLPALIPSCSFISFQEKYLWIVKKNVLKFPKIFQIFAKNLFEFKQQKLIKTTKCWELHYYSECHISFTMLLSFQLVYSILLVYHRWSNVQPCLLIPSCLFIRYVRVGSWRRASSYTNYLNIST